MYLHNMFKRGLIILLMGCLVFSYSCKWPKTKKEKVVRDTTITPNTSFNEVFFDSAVVASFLSTHNEYDSFHQQFSDFYQQRNYEYAWFDSAGISEQAHNFFNLQNNYISTLGDSSIYSNQLHLLYDSLGGKKLKAINNVDLLNAELLLTGQFFKYASKVYKGSDIDATELGWFIPRKKINLTALLDSVIIKKGSEPEQYFPLNAQYKLLEKYLIQYIELEKKESSDTIAYVVKPIKMGDSAKQIVGVKRKLMLLDQTIRFDSSAFYDSTLFLSVKKMQRRFGLMVDGAIGNKMITELNVSLKKRIQQILVNMERTRWMPEENDQKNYILVNIPEYKMHVYDSSKQVFEMNVIVGSSANNTVIFNGNLQYVVFSPYWNVPESIVKNEIMPAMQKDKNYIEKHNMEIMGYSGKMPIVRQKPGANNSLGLVKFLFPNNYNIYLHDTPNRNLFTQSNRNLSHGCIRIAEPAKFAGYLLREDSAIWNRKKIDSMMHLTKEKWVTLKKPVPVFLVYFTAWVDKNEQLHFRKDIYGHDEKMMTKLFSK
jgi:L,D-transpeptidase YcbB